VFYPLSILNINRSPQKTSTRVKKEAKGSKKAQEAEQKFNHGGWSHDVALEITDHTILEENDGKNVSGAAALNKVLFQVSWKKRKDGVQPAPTFYRYNTLKKKCPYLLLDYVEGMVQFS